MKKIEAIIKPFKLTDVKEKLKEAGVYGMTAYEVRGFGRQKGHSEIYRGSEYQIDFIAKIKLEIVASDEMAPKVAEIVRDAAKTGQIGDGKIFVSDISQAIRIRTNDQGEDAL
ncbi:MAG: P-II family nitrogen regulator [bacterium]